MAKKVSDFVTATEMFDTLVGQGLIGSEVRLALDLAHHAKVKATESVRIVVETAPPHLKLLVYCLSWEGIIASRNQPSVREEFDKLLTLGVALAAGFTKERETSSQE